MIVFKVDKDENLIKEIIVEGHANQGKKTSPSVCAAISMATIMTANAIKYLNLDMYIVLHTEDGYFELKTLSGDNTLQKLLKNLEFTLEEMIRQYPEYVRWGKIEHYPF
jgi:uncharacterized protein